MNLSSQDTIDTLTLFLPHCHSLTKPNLEVWPGPARKRKKLSTREHKYYEIQNAKISSQEKTVFKVMLLKNNLAYYKCCLHSLE